MAVNRLTWVDTHPTVPMGSLPESSSLIAPPPRVSTRPPKKAGRLTKGAVIERPLGGEARWRLGEFDPKRADFAPYGFTCTRWSPRRMARPDRHNEVELNFVGEGSLTYLLGGRRLVVEAGQLAVFWAAIPHQLIEFEGTQHYFVVTIPLDWFLRRRLPDRLVQPLLQGQLICAGFPGRWDLEEARLTSWAIDLASGDADLMRAMHLELEARLLRFAFQCPERIPEVGGGSRRLPIVREGGMDKAEQMARHIALSCTEPLTVQAVAEAVHLHPRFAMGLFHRVFGTTLVNYVTQHRISHAQRLLVTTDLRIVDVGAASGFGSLSRFNIAFRRACGCSPRDYRRIHRAQVQ